MAELSTDQQGAKLEPSLHPVIQESLQKSTHGFGDIFQKVALRTPDEVERQLFVDRLSDLVGNLKFRTPEEIKELLGGLMAASTYQKKGTATYDAMKPIAEKTIQTLREKYRLE